MICNAYKKGGWKEFKKWNKFETLKNKNDNEIHFVICFYEMIKLIFANLWILILLSDDAIQVNK